MGAIGETVGPELGVPVEPLAAGLAADVVAPAELSARRGGCSASSTKRWRWYMGDVTLQGIGASSEAPRLWRCHPSGENKVLPAAAAAAWAVSEALEQLGKRREARKHGLYYLMHLTG
jgi:hypothetical protein